MAVSPEIFAALDTAAREHGIDPALLRGVAYVESRFDPTVRSPKGALGLVQLMPDTAAELGVTDPFNPLDNARGGAKYLRRLIARYGGDVSTALAAYNWGMGKVAAANASGRGWPDQVRTYVARVLDRRALEAKAIGLPPPLPQAAAEQPLAPPSPQLRCSQCGHAIDARTVALVVAALERNRKGPL